MARPPFPIPPSVILHIRAEQELAKQSIHDRHRTHFLFMDGQCLLTEFNNVLFLGKEQF
jgi:hypothetical protein